MEKRMEEKKYLYADRQEQIKKVHQLMIVIIFTGTGEARRS